MLKNDLIAWLITVAAAAVGLKNWPGLGLAGLLKLQGKEGLLKTFFENLKLFIHFLENYNVILQSNLPTFNVMGSLKFYLGEKTVKCNY